MAGKQPAILNDYNKNEIIFCIVELMCLLNPPSSSIHLPVRFPFLNSAITSGNLFSISIRKCSSNSFTLFTGTSFDQPIRSKVNNGNLFFNRKW